MLKFLSRPIYGAVAVFVIAFIVYLQTMAHGLGFIDSGELATVCSTLGIAHPTGYPFFTLIGSLFAHLPIAEHIITRLNIMSALFSALGAGAVVFLGHEIHLYWLELRKKKIAVDPKKKKTIEPEITTTNETKKHQAVAAGIFTGLIIAFSETWWTNSTSIEVYPLHQLFLPVVLTFFLRMLRNESDNTKLSRDGLLFALTLGLSFSNHLTTVLLAPACLYMYFGCFGFGASSWKRIGKLSLPFAIGLLPYLYLFLRAGSYPLMDWGHPADMGSFMKHVTGGQYKIWMFQGGAGENWKYFWKSLPGEFYWLMLVMSIAGIAASFRAMSRKRAHILPFLLLLFFGCLFYAINYSIHDIDSYFLLAYLAFALLCSIAFSEIGFSTARLTMRITSYAYVALWFGVLLGAGEMVAHYSSVDESGNHMVDDYTQNMLKNLPKDAIIFSSAWDFWVSGSFYYQHIEKLRPDVTVIDLALLRDRPWYYSHIKQIAPDLLQNCKAELDAFMPNLIAFDRGDNFSGQAIGETYKAFTEALVRNNQSRPIFITSELLQERDGLFAPSFKPIPAGFAFRLSERDTLFSIPIPTIEWNDKNYRERNYYTDNARLLQALPLAASAEVLQRQGKLEEAKKMLDVALRFKPDMAIDLETLKERDRNFAIMVNEKFARFQEMGDKLGK